MTRMIYLDNAATSLPKPPEVAEAVAQAINGFGGAGRGMHPAAADAAMAAFEARRLIAQLAGAPNPSCVAFAANATAALNCAIAELVRPGDHVVTTAASHNSVLRPLWRKEDKEGCRISVAPIAPDGSLDYDAVESLFEDGTRLMVATHASNLTGDVYDMRRLAQICHGRGALLVVDAAQTAGALPIDMARDGIDVLAFTGHKSLFGPQGTGGLVVMPHVDVPAFMVGGAGMRSYDRHHAPDMPERLEAGTLNAHGIAGLAAGVAHVLQVGPDQAARTVEGLRASFEQAVRALPGVTVYGGGTGRRCGIVALNVRDLDSAAVADLLARHFGICVRAGAHCAPLMHRALGTEHQGAVRFSFTHLTDPADVAAAADALGQIARGA